LRRKANHLVKRHQFGATATLRSATAASVLDENLPHPMRCDSEEVRATLPVRQFTTNKTQIYVVN
jgi:hypothetical protein